VVSVKGTVRSRARPAKPARESVAEMAEAVLPSDANPMGTAFGGKIVQWIDLCAALSAQRHCRSPVVTVSMDDLHFHAPIRIGDVALLTSKVTAAFRSSMEVEVTVMAENPVTGETRLCTSAYLTFVALDETGRPTRVPPLLVESAEERHAFALANERRAARLSRAKRT
jgi:acyl-CoA hydrolase